MVRGRWVVGAGAGSSRPDVPDLVLGIDRDRVLREFLHHGLVSGDGRFVAALFFPGPAEIELRPGGVLPVGRGPNDHRENLRGLVHSRFKGNAEELQLCSHQIRLADAKHGFDGFPEALALWIFFAKHGVALGGEQVFVGLLLQLSQPVTRSGCERVFRVFLHDQAVGFHGRAEISAPLRFLGALKKLLRRAARLIFAGRSIPGFFPGFKDDGGRDRGGQSEADQERERKYAKGVFHRVAQGS